MNPAIADVMIHVDETLPPAGMSAIADSVFDNLFVVSGFLSNKANHLIMVRYDSDAIRARDILEQVWDCGVGAELVGF